MGLGHGRLDISTQERHRILRPEGESTFCAYCDEPDPTEVDHIVPASRGGLTSEDNLAAACARCNYEKRARTINEWRDWRLAQGRCWPPRDRWSARLGLIDALHGLLGGDDFIALLQPVVEWPMPVPVDAWFEGWAKRVHRGLLAPLDQEAASLVVALRDLETVAEEGQL
jgi:hypothetical protein